MQLYNDDCLNVLKQLPDNSVDSLVTDPPAGIAFMGLEFDSDKGGRTQWIAWLSEIMRECVRVLKPGAHGLVWALPKTSHWTGTALEDAGFEVKDMITHLFGSGFPKSLNIGKAIDKKLGLERTVVGEQNYSFPDIKNNSYDQPDITGSRDRLKINITTPASDEAKKWDGWGSQLKPAVEFWFLVRKPLSEKTITDNVLKYGTGGLNIDASRVGNELVESGRSGSTSDFLPLKPTDKSFSQGRFPSHLLLSHSEGCKCVGKKDVKLNGSGKCSGNTTPDKSMFNIGSKELCYGQGNGKETVDNWQCEDGCPVKELDEQSGVLKSGKHSEREKERKAKGMFAGGVATDDNWYGDIGGASRFFKTFEPEWQCVDGCPVKELDEQSGILKSGGGVKHHSGSYSSISGWKGTTSDGPYCQPDQGGASRFFKTFEPALDKANFFYCPKTSTSERNAGLSQSKNPNTGEKTGNRCQPKMNHHPTVKSIKLMSYLIRLTTPPNGVVLDPFMGSGSTGLACKELGFDFIGIEKELDYFEIAKARIEGHKVPEQKNKKVMQPLFGGAK